MCNCGQSNSGSKLGHNERRPLFSLAQMQMHIADASVIVVPLTHALPFDGSAAEVCGIGSS